MNEKKQLAEKILIKFGKMKSDRHNWNRHWDEVSEYFVPRKDQALGERSRGEKKSFSLLYDTTSIHSLELLASALQGMLTNPTSIWFGLSTGNKEIDNNQAAREWLQDSTLRMLRVLNDSNFNTEVYEVYIDLAGFGTSFLNVSEDDEKVVNFESRPIYEAHIAENHKGLVDTVYFEYKMTHEQIVQKFGEKALMAIYGDRWEDVLKAKPLEQQKILHAVEPREKVKYTISPMVPKNRPFSSYWVHCETATLLKEDGYYENPYIVSRWSKYSGEIYGRSPGMKALPDAKMLNKMKKATIEAAQLAVAPPLQVPDDGVLLPIKTAPNSINYYRAGSKDRIEPMMTGNRIDLGESLMETVRAQIKQAFFVDQLNLVENDRMTATEVLHRKEEQLRLLGPTLSRQHFEFLRPLIDRVFGIMARKEMFLPAPEILQNQNLKVEYTSLIAKAQLATEGDNLNRAIALVAPFVETDPSIMDNFNGDEIVKFASRIYGLPADIIRKEEERDEIREGRAQAQQQMVQQEQDLNDAEVISKTK